MGPDELGVLSTTLADMTRDRHQTTQAYRTANAYSTVSSQSPGAKAPRRFSLRLDVELSPQILQTYRWFYHLTAASHVVESMMCSRAPLLDRHYPVSTLIRTRPPPSRLWPISRGNRLYGLPCSSHFCLGRGRLLQLLSMPLSPCYPYHPAGGARLNSQSATHPAAFARPQRARPPGLFLSGPLAGLLALWPGDSLTILTMALSVSFTSFVSSTGVTQATGR